MPSSGPSAVPQCAGPTAAHAHSTEPLSTLVYRSRAVAAPSEADLLGLQTLAQARNRAEAITGLLIYDDGHFFQWLEGPPRGLGRVWDAIRGDPRHTAIELLGDAPTPMRFFADWDLKLSIGHAGRNDAASAPTVDALALFGAHQRGPAAPPVPPFTPSLQLARLLTAADAGAAFALLDRLQGQAGSIAGLCATLFEPAARALGDLWQADDCNEFEVTLGLWRLQTAMRRADTGAMPAAAARVPTVLVAPQPGEPHMFGAALDAELLWRAGWDAHCEQPATDDALQSLLASAWFDALDLSLSASFRREHWLPRMATSIALARRASRNPALVVVVGGRVFADPAGAPAWVGADACCTTALQVAPAILHALQTRR